MADQNTNNTSNISSPVYGLVTNMHQLNTQEGFYGFALNAIGSDKSGNEFFLQNEGSNVCAVTFPPDYRVVGFKNIPELSRTVYFLTNPTTGGNQIGEVIQCNYKDITDKIEKVFCTNCSEYKGELQTPLEQKVEMCYCQYLLTISDPCLAFDIHYPVDIEYKITNCQLQLYFTDNINERRYIYFDFNNNDLTEPLTLNENFKVCSTDTVCQCPDGYTLDEETLECTKRVLTPLTPSEDLRTACAATNGAYTNFGVALYSTFNTNGTGDSVVYHAADLYWSNPLSNLSTGVLNRTAIWPCDEDGNPQGFGDNLPLNEPVGFIFPVEVPDTKTYFVGIAGDNKVRIRVDCNTFVDMDPEAVSTQYGVGLAATFKYWHVYPITLTAGRHVFELTGENAESAAGFGAEIYDNTADEIINSTDGSGLNILFSTADKRGDSLQISETFSGTCDSGDCIDVDEDGNLFCINIDTVEANCDDCQAVFCEDLLDCEKIKFHPNFNRPCIRFNDFVNGGNLKAGVYQVLVAYVDIFGNPISNYFPSTQTAPLFRDQITFETNYQTDKALSFTVTGLRNDSVFKYYNIVIASTQENFTEFIMVGTFSTNQTNYVYTGFEKAPKRLTPAEVFFRRPYYKTAKGVSSSNNYLFFTGVKEYRTLNLQPVANKVKLQWQTVAVKEKAYFDPRNTFYFHTYQRDEVYAFALVFEFDNGRDACAFHVPGRAAVGTDLEIVTGNDVLTDIDCNTEPRNLRWQVYNTANIVDGDYQYSEHCDDLKCWEYGDFAYWESTRTYPKVPEIWGNLCGQPIRHHKFPDSCVTHIHDGTGDKTFFDSNYIFPIGVKVDHQSVLTAIVDAVNDGIITQEDADSIVSYRIVRGNRVGNKSVDAKGLLYNMWSYNKFGTDYYYANYPYNDLNDDDFIAPDDSTYDGSTTSDPIPSIYYRGNDRFTFHGPDVHFVNASLGNILKLETEEFGESEGYFTHSDCQAKHKFPSTAARAIALGFGVAAALSATGDKVCRTVTQSATTTVGVTAGTTVGNLFIVDPLAAFGYQPDTGLPLIPYPLASESAVHSCRGETWQIINVNPIVNAILGFGGAGLGVVIQKVILGLIEADKVLQTMKALIPHKNYSTQYNSVGKYNNYSCVTAGSKRRKIEKSAYLAPIMQSIDEPSATPLSGDFTTIKVNNWDRESSVYIKIPTNVPIAEPVHTDDSRVTMDKADLDFNDLEKNVYRNISSYYASVKREVLDQYGELCNIEYLETNSCSFFLDTFYSNCNETVFGGDTFISRFALKRKMPFFLHTMCGVDNDTDVKYSELGNVGYPNYYFNTEEPFFERMSNLSISIGDIGATLQAIVGTNQTRLDAKTSKFFYQNGYAHLFSYGVPYFLVESDINTDFRHGQDNLAKDFYPHNTDLKTWLQEDAVPINEDNTYFYNKTYSKQNKESVICTSCILDIKQLDCQNPTDNRLIYSEVANADDKNDNWLIFKANNFYDFPLRLGKLISADGIESDKVLVRLTQATQIFAAYNTIQATGENIQVGTGGLFQSRPRDIATTTLGYAGTQNRDILHTEFGHIWADARSGQVFNLEGSSGSIDEISKEYVTAWLAENLSFQLRKDFPEVNIEDVDNNLNGAGLHYCFDKRFKRLLITKLDYKVISSAVQYDKINKIFFITVDNAPVEVSLTDPTYFCNKSWTLSYSFTHKTWISYHTYRPNFYVANVDTFDSSHTLGDTQKMYTHNATNKSFQVFYGKLEPFIVELQSKKSIYNNFVNSFEYSADVIRYHNEFDTVYNRTKTFNKGILYNERQCSGLLNFVVADEDDMGQSVDYPKRTRTGYEVITTNSENIWRFNDFWDVVDSQLNNVPIFNLDCNNVNKQLNYKALNNNKPDLDRAGLRQRMLRVRLIQDRESLYHYILHFGQINSTQSFR